MGLWSCRLKRSLATLIFQFTYSSQSFYCIQKSSSDMPLAAVTSGFGRPQRLTSFIDVACSFLYSTHMKTSMRGCKMGKRINHLKQAQEINCTLTHQSDRDSTNHCDWMKPAFPSQENALVTSQLVQMRRQKRSKITGKLNRWHTVDVSSGSLCS